MEFGSIDDLQEALERDGHRIAAFMIEPIQGSAGYVTLGQSRADVKSFPS